MVLLAGYARQREAVTAQRHDTAETTLAQSPTRTQLGGRRSRPAMPIVTFFNLFMKHLS